MNVLLKISHLLTLTLPACVNIFFGWFSLYYYYYHYYCCCCYLEFHIIRTKVAITVKYTAMILLDIMNSELVLPSSLYFTFKCENIINKSHYNSELVSNEFNEKTD